MIDNLEIILPISLLGLAFLLKLSIDRNIDVPNVIQAICELPADIVFLAISFLTAFTISSQNNNSKGLLYCIIFIGLAVLIVILWRKSLNLFEKKSKYWIVILGINLILSCFSLFQSMNILIPQEKIEIKNNPVKIEKNGNK